MKKISTIIFVFVCITLFAAPAYAQCSVCSKTALQLGEKPAQGLNAAILYLMVMPFAIVGFIGFRWWRNNRHFEDKDGG